MLKTFCLYNSVFLRENVNCRIAPKLYDSLIMLSDENLTVISINNVVYVAMGNLASARAKTRLRTDM